MMPICMSNDPLKFKNRDIFTQIHHFVSFDDMGFPVRSIDSEGTFKMKPNLLQFMSRGKLPC